MNAEELKKERRYRFSERIGMLCGTADPTREQAELALKEADEANKLFLEEIIVARIMLDSRET